MKTRSENLSNRALTLFEVLVVIAILFIFIAMIPFAMPNATRKARRIQCVSNLKQVGLSFRIWAGDHGDKYPMQISETNGGTMEYLTGANAYRHFQTVSNELSTPWALYCPAESDRWRVQANAFDLAAARGRVLFASNTNLSYFIGVDADQTNVTMILTGDHNITNGTPIVNGTLTVTSNNPAGWTDGVHSRVGNIGLADGSVLQVSLFGLRRSIVDSGFETNRLQMP